MGSAFEAVRGFYEEAAEKLGLELSLREALSTHAREVTVQVRVPMDFGGFKVFKGYRVQHNNARGPFKGGLRFHPKVSLDEIRTFDMLMTWKTALMNIPPGGGAAVCLELFVKSRGWQRGDSRVAMQGYGNAGSWRAIILSDLGYPILGVSDSKGGVLAENGLGPKAVLEHTHETGIVIGFP